MAIKDGTLTNADEVVNAIGSVFNDAAQNLFNSDYIGFDSRLNNTGVPNLKNVVYSTFTSDDADETQNLTYDSTNDLYTTEDQTDASDYYVDIYATSLTIAGFAINDCKAYQVAKGGAVGNVWRVTCDTGTAAVKKAQVIKTLFYGTNGSDPSIIDHVTNVTAIKSSDSNDVGKQVHYAEFHTLPGATVVGATYTGTFANTSTNTGCEFWSYLYAQEGSAREDGITAIASFPGGTVVNSVSPGTGASATSDETGTDRTADKDDNPATVQISATGNIPIGGGAAQQIARAIILGKGDITWVNSGFTYYENTDFFTDSSIPLFTAADLSLTVSYAIFKDTASESVTNAIPVINSTIDATSSEQISVSADGGSNWTDVDNAEIARPTAGTALWRRIVITRTDLSVEDIVTEQACKYNLY